MELFKRTKLFLLGALSLSLMGCPDTDIDPINPGPINPDPISPKEQKTILKDTGMEFIKAIDAEDHENLVEVLAYMEDAGFGEYEMDEDYIENLEGLYTETEDPDYYNAVARNTNPAKAIQGMMALSLDAAQSRAKLSTRADDIYMFTLEAGLKDFYGGFKPNMSREMWVYDSSITDRIEVSFTDDNNQKWVATLKGSKETTTVHLAYEDKYHHEWVSSWDGSVYENDYHDKYDLTIEVPKKISLTVACNSKTVINMTVNSSLAFEGDMYWEDYSYDNYYTDDYEYDYDFQLTIDYKNLNLDAVLDVNGYTETWDVKASKSSITAAAEVKIDDKSMLKANATLNADIEAISKQLDKDLDLGDDDLMIEDYAKHIKSFTMNMDVMGKVQIAGKCLEFEELCDAMLDAIDASEVNHDFEKFERKINLINDYYNVSVFYDNTETVQAQIVLEAYEYEPDYDSYYDSYFEVRPVLVFTYDDSRYCFEDYFTERSFDELIDAAEDWADDLERMVERYF